MKFSSSVALGLAIWLWNSTAIAQSTQCPDPRAPRFEGLLEGRTTLCRGVVGFSSTANASYTGYMNGQPGLLLNVAPGIVAPGSTDAVNGGQLSAIGSALARATDDAASLRFDLARLSRAQQAGEARTAALAGIPQAITPGAGMVGIGVGGAGNAKALAVGAAKAFDDQHTIAKAAISFASRTDRVTWNVGMGYQF